MSRADWTFIGLCIIAALLIFAYGYSFHTGDRGPLSKKVIKEFNINVIEERKINGTPQNVIVIHMWGTYSSKGDITSGREVKIRIVDGHLSIYRGYRSIFLNETRSTKLYIDHSIMPDHQETGYINVLVSPVENQYPDNYFLDYRLKGVEGGEEVIFKSEGIFGARFEAPIPTTRGEWGSETFNTENVFEIGPSFIGEQLEHSVIMIKFALITLYFGIVGVLNIFRTISNKKRKE